jgi:hypothetical protein
MAYYLVRAKADEDLLAELRSRLDSGEIKKMKPFGTALQHGLDNARLDDQGEGLICGKDDYCKPPLAQETPRCWIRFTDLGRARCRSGWAKN